MRVEGILGWGLGKRLEISRVLSSQSMVLIGDENGFGICLEEVGKSIKQSKSNMLSRFGAPGMF